MTMTGELRKRFYIFKKYFKNFLCSVQGLSTLQLVMSEDLEEVGFNYLKIRLFS